MLKSAFRSMLRAPSVAWKVGNDRWLNIETCVAPDGVFDTAKQLGTKHHDNFAFASVDYWDARRILRHLSLCRDDVVFEIGAGLGRIACLFARHPIARVTAIELNPLLAERVRRNAAALRGRRTTLEVRSEDAVHTRFDDGTVLFFYNPFGPDTFNDVLTNIRGTLTTNPRRMRIVYVNPLGGHREVITRNNWLTQTHAMTTLHGLEVLFLEARSK